MDRKTVRWSVCLAMLTGIGAGCAPHPDWCREIRLGIDRTGDGQLDRGTKWVYESDTATLKAFDIDDSEDRVSDTPKRVIDFGKDGRKRLKLRDRDSDWSDRTKVVWKYDAAGRKRKKLHYPAETSEVEPSQIVTWEYDSAGRRVRKETTDTPDGDPTRVETWTYNEAGRPIRRRVDGGRVESRDGSPDVVESWTYDDAGRLIRRQVDGRRRGSRNGSPNLVETWTYDERGRKVDGKRVSRGRVDRVTTWEYDQAGRKVRAVVDGGYYGREQDGDADEIRKWTYEAGRKVRFEVDGAGPGRPDGTPDHVQEWVYDEQGRRILWGSYTTSSEASRISAATPTEPLVAVQLSYNDHGQLVRRRYYRRFGGHLFFLKPWAGVEREAYEDLLSNVDPDYVRRRSYTPSGCTIPEDTIEPAPELSDYP